MRKIGLEVRTHTKSGKNNCINADKPRTLLKTRKAMTEKSVAAKMSPTTRDVSGVDGSASRGASL